MAKAVSLEATQSRFKKQAWEDLMALMNGVHAEEVRSGLHFTAFELAK